MAEQPLKKLRRDELLRMLLELERENEQLAEENAQLRQQLAARKVSLSDAGTLAEASVRLSGLFEAAQDTADLYLENVRSLCLDYARKTTELCDDTIVRGGSTGQLEEQVRALFDNAQGEGEVRR